MIDKTNLRKLSVEALRDLKKAVAEVLEDKVRAAITYGTIVQFQGKVRGGGRRTVRIKVTGFGPTNLSGVEIDASGNEMAYLKWRVHPSLCTPVEPPTHAPVKPVGVGGDRPMGQNAGMF